MRGQFIRFVVAAIVFAASPHVVRSQGHVTGQVSILERDNETTSDLGNAVIYLEPLSATPKTKQKELHSLIALQARAFQPRVRVVPVGSRVEFPNQDSFNHNVFTNSALGEFDLGVYGKGKSRDATFKRAGLYPIYCNIHARMTGYVIAVATPYFTQPGIDGRFEIPNVPPGRYAMSVWHERAATQKREITVAATGADGLAVELDARGYKRVTHRNKFGQEYKSTGGDRY
jgi:plastocyanin